MKSTSEKFAKVIVTYHYLILSSIDILEYIEIFKVTIIFKNIRNGWHFPSKEPEKIDCITKMKSSKHESH